MTTEAGSVPRWLRHGLLAWLLLIPVAIAFGLSGNRAAPALTMLICSVPEMAGGLWLLWRAKRRLPGGHAATGRVLLAIGLTLLGLGRTLLGLHMLLGDPRFPNPFYAMAHVSTAFAALGIILLPRAQNEPLRGLRTMTEGLVLASGLTVALEVLWLEGIFGGALTSRALLAMFIALSSSWLLGLVFAILIREQARWIGWLALALVLLLTADLITWQAVWNDEVGSLGRPMW